MPIARWSTARFMLARHDSLVRVVPAHKTKSQRLARAMLSRYGVARGGILRLDGDLPEGKGMASSSADLVSAARAVGRAIGVEPGAAEIEALLRQIEPSDGVMYDGVVAFYHKNVRLLSRLGHLPPMTVVGIDEGGQVDTVDFNGRRRAFSPGQREEYDRLLATLNAAPKAAGAVATR